MSLMERSQLAHYVWYINYSDTLTGVFLFIDFLRMRHFIIG